MTVVSVATIGGGVLTQKISRYTKISKLALAFFGSFWLFLNFKIGEGFCGFLFFFSFFKSFVIGFGQN